MHLIKQYIFCIYILLSGTSLYAANDTLYIDGRRMIVQGDSLSYNDGMDYVECSLDKERDPMTLTIYSSAIYDSLYYALPIEQYMPLMIKDYVDLAHRTGLLAYSQACRQCMYCYESRSIGGYSSVSFVPDIVIEYKFYSDGRPRKIFIIDTIMRDPSNILQATEINYGSCHDTLSTRQIVLRYDSAGKDLYWIVDGLVVKNEQLNMIKRRQFFADGIIREEEIYFRGSFVQRVKYPTQSPDK